ncbi:MAG: polyphenol oxidase family protein [Candidatus Eisenbacteria bacterium]
MPLVEYRWRFITREAFSFYAVVDAGQRLCAGAVTTRHRNLPSGTQADFNLSSRAAEEGSVAENRRALLNAFELEEEEAASPEQTHGSLVLGADSPGLYPHADGLASSNAMIWLGILVADCVPVFAFRPDLGVVGVAHAGRTGTSQGITAQLIRLMTSRFLLDPGELVVALGPSIGPCCYELDAATASTLAGEFVIQRKEKPSFDLWSANISQAVEGGVPFEHVLPPPACTSCSSNVLFSHRADGGRTGRQIAVTRAGGLRMGLGSG